MMRQIPAHSFLCLIRVTVCNRIRNRIRNTTGNTIRKSGSGAIHRGIGGAISGSVSTAQVVSVFVLVAIAANTSRGVSAQTPGNCVLGQHTVDLDIGNVRARLYNNGGLFWRGAGNVYNVPKAEEGQPISPNGLFASSIWIGGTTGTQVRTAAQAYGNWEYWPGPLDENGNPPADCSEYDHIYLVSRVDVANYESGQDPIPDLANWPAELGAPVIDGDGVPGNYNLEGGDRPDILGDQMAWWVMNDVGNVHENTGTPPIGIELQVSAFAFARPGDIGNSTAYRYKIIYKGAQPLTDAWFGIWSDPDLGNATDDYVGSDTTLGLGFVYNADNDDEGSDGYGTPAPALGYDFYQGPLVASPGESHTDPDGTVHTDSTRLQMTRFLYYNGDGSYWGNPRGQTTDWYNYLRGIWQDGTPMCFGRFGYPGFPGCEGVAHYMYPGDPVTKSYWSEFNVDDEGTSNPPSDRRLILTTGPFVMNPGDTQEIVYGIVWARGIDNLDSVTKMRQASEVVQRAFEAGFRLPDGPDAPEVSASPHDGGVTLTWRNDPNSNNYVERFDAVSPFSYGPDYNYSFEGYEVYQFPSASFDPNEATRLAVFDEANRVKEVRETTIDGFVRIVAEGTDSGVQHHFVVEGLKNYSEYYFGVRGYAYNGDTDVGRVLRGPMGTVSVIPTALAGSVADSAVVLAADFDSTDIVAVAAPTNKGDGRVAVDVVDPASVVDATYEVRFRDMDRADSSATSASLTFDILRDEALILDGSASGDPLPQKESLMVLDGLRFSVTGPDAGIKYFLVTQNAAGPLDPPEMGTLAFNRNGFPFFDGHDRPDGARQQSTAPDGFAGWGMNVGGGANDGTYTTFESRSLRNNNLDFIGVYDYEMRFTAEGGFGYRGFNDGVIVRVPFELWRTGIRTPDDPGDDVRLIPILCEEACGAGTTAQQYDLGTTDHGVSGGQNDPFTDWVYWYTPEDESAGTAGYDAVFDDAVAGTEIAADKDAMVVHELFARTVLVNWNGGDVPGPYNMPLPEEGTIFRIETFKPSQPADSYSFSTDGLGVTAPDVAREVAALEEIGMVPNPYKGGSAYEVSSEQDVVRFTNMPEVATIRVFAVSGTLVATLEKNDPDRYFDWDLTNDYGRKIGSGVYLVHVDVPNVGSHVIKFGVVIGGAGISVQ